MTTMKQIYFASLLALALLSTATAQDSTTAQRSSLTITASAVDDRVRITAPSSVVQIHVEVYAASGEKLFDQEIRGGNVFDWHLQDGQAQRLAPGDYVCVVTAKSVSGRLTQKIGAVRVEEKSVSVQAAESPKLSVQQTQAIGPVEENPSWTIAAKDKPQTGTVIAHDGTDGQMIRGRGALTFRIGNFFSGIDTEQMRLTETGNLGIGTSEPMAKLDVSGTIRAQRFLIAKPRLAGVDKTDALAAADTADSVQPLVAGTGTQNQIAKWTDNVGTLGDSGITETVGGNVGIGTTSPTTKLHIFGDETADTFAGMGVDPSSFTGGALNFGMGGHSWGKGSGFINVRRTADGTLPTFRFMTNGIERIFIDQAGNVGIGTTTPANRLHVNGDILMTTAPGNAVQFSTPNAETGMSIIRTNIGRADLRFDGSTLKLVTGPANSGPPDATNGIAIDAAGHVGIGTTSPQAQLDVAGLFGGGGLISIFRVGARFGAGGIGMDVNNNGQVTVGGNVLPGNDNAQTLGTGTNRWAAVFAANGMIQTSDARLKQRVTSLGYGLREVLRLRPVSFQWKDRADGELHLGFIAQEVELLIPEVVSRGKDLAMPLGLNYSALVPVVIKAIQEQQGTIKTLKAENTTLRQQNVTLEARVTALERMKQELKGSASRHNRSRRREQQ